MMAMSEMPDFRVNKTESSKGLLPLFLAVGWDRWDLGSPSYEDALAFVLAFRGVDPNIQDKFGYTALFIVAYRGLSRFVKRLLATPGIDINLPNKTGVTPLGGAANQGHPECLKLLLKDTRIKVNKADEDACTPLNHAICALSPGPGNLECVKLLLEVKDVDVNKATTYEGRVGWTPLLWAANLGMFKYVELLLQDPRINVNKPDGAGCFPLYHACMHMTIAMSSVGVRDGRFDDFTDPVRGLVLFLQSRRVSTKALDHTIDLWKIVTPTKREIAVAEAGGKPLDDWHRMAQHVLPILKAQTTGHRRWCDWCQRVTTDRNLLMCAGCDEVGYCDRVCCQKNGWSKGGHREKCTGLAAEAKEVKARSGVGGGGGGKTGKKRGKKKKDGRRR